MYAWYQQAAEAFAYLHDVHCSSVTPEDEVTALWNSRCSKCGWTLQELIAPSKVAFFNSSWGSLGNKTDLCSHLFK